MSQTITGTIGTGVTLTTQSTTISSTARLTTGGGVEQALYGTLNTSTPLNVTNFGTIIGSNFEDVVFANNYGDDAVAGTIDNESGGLIEGSGGYGIISYGPALIENAANGTITGDVYAIGLEGDPADVINGGLVQSAGIAVLEIGQSSTSTLSVVNEAGGTISGNEYSIFLESGDQELVNNQAGGTIIGDVELDSGGTVTNAGAITAGSSEDAVNFTGASAPIYLIADPGATFTGIVTASAGNLSTTLELAKGSGAAGTLDGIGSTILNFRTIVFDTGADWTISGDQAGFNSGTLAGFVRGDTIEFTGITVTGSSFSGGLLTLDEASGSATLNLTGTFSAGEFVVTNVAGGADVTVLCFCVNTLIDTPAGSSAVQDLTAGDLVVTAGGGARPIAWIGTGSVLATRGRRSAATPVIVRKGALADNVPYQDLRVTKGHAFLIDGVLIPVEFLVNHRSILWDDRAQEVELYHIELETHDVLIANGAPAESYRDDGNRWLFHNANTGWDQPAKAPCARVLTGGPIVDAVWRRLLDRAGSAVRVPLTEAPDLHLKVDGVRIDAAYRQGVAVVFRLTDVPAAVRIASRSVVPQEVGLARDARRLGVALRRIVVRQGVRFRDSQADDAALVDGFNPYESNNDFIWTDGDAGLPATLLTGLSGPVEVVLVVGGTTTYVDEGIRTPYQAAWG